MTIRMIAPLAGALVLSVVSMGQSIASDHEFRYAQAELATEGGAIDVYARIARLAADVCDERLGRHSLVKKRAAHDRCEAEVIENLVTDINDPRLTYLHAAKSHDA